MTKNSPLLADLTRDYFTRTSAKEAYNIFTEQRKRKKLSVLLRHHNEKAISDDETWDRDAIDNLLSYYGLIEVACSGALLAPPFPAKLTNAAIDFLSDDAVKDYTEKNYPVLLPKSFLKRIKNGGGNRDTELGATRLMFRFLDLNLLIEQDPDVDAFLWFREAGIYGSHDMTTVYETLSDPTKLIRLFLKAPRQTDWTLRAIMGLQKFLEFSLSLAELLEDTKEHPHLQRSFYEQHAYWYLHASYSMREVMRAVRTAFSRLPSSKDLLQIRMNPKEFEKVDACLQMLENFRSCY